MNGAIDPRTWRDYWLDRQASADDEGWFYLTQDETDDDLAYGGLTCENIYPFSRNTRRGQTWNQHAAFNIDNSPGLWGHSRAHRGRY